MGRRRTTRSSCKHYTRTYAPVSWRRPSSCVGKRTSHGALRVSEAPSYSSGTRLVSPSCVTPCASSTYSRPYAANEPRDEDAMEDEDAEDSQQWRGNVRRRMWKTVCQRAALNVRLVLSLRRPLYSPSSRTLTHMALNCGCNSQRSPQPNAPSTLRSHPHQLRPPPSSPTAGRGRTIYGHS